MATKFIKMIELQERLEGFSKAELLEFIQVLIEQNHGDMIIKGLFRQLHGSNFDDDSKNDQFITKLLNTCDCVSPRSIPISPNVNSNCDINLFANIPDSLLARIASYIPQKQIFLCWSHVNRRFIQATMQPQVLHSFSIIHCYSPSITRDLTAPKFKLNLSPLSFKYLGNYCEKMQLQLIVNSVSLKSLTKLIIGM